MASIPNSQVNTGGMPYQPWRSAMVPAAFRGVVFKVQNDSQSGGRRGPTHEFPNRNTPWTEDMGRRAQRWAITGYVIGQDCISQRNNLIQALDADGTATLQHPTLGSVQAKCDTYTVTEDKERGGIFTFQMSFSEAGSLSFAATPNTQASAIANASALGQTAATSLDAALQSSLADTNGAVTA